MRFLTATISLTIFLCTTTGANANPISTLLCEATIQGQILQRVLKLDYANMKVNEVPARFSDAEISWTTARADERSNQVIYSDHHVNRLSGIYYSTTRGGHFIPSGPPTSFSCRKAPPQMF